MAKKTGENPNLSVPIPGSPYFSEFWVGGFVKLVVDVGVVGGVSGSDLESVDGDCTVAGVGVFGL